MITNSVYLFLLLVFLLATVWYYYYYYFKYEKHLKKFPGPVTIPIIGTLVHLFLFWSTKSIIPGFIYLEKTYGRTHRVYLGVEPHLLIADYKGMEFVLSSNSLIEKGTTYRYLRNWLGTGLLTSTGDKWRTRRKIITPALHFKILEQFIDTFNSASEILVNKLKVEVGKDMTDIYPYVALSTLDIICESAMGISMNAQENSHSEYVKQVRLMSKIFMERTFSTLSDCLYFFTKNYYLEKKAIKILHTFTNNVIQQRKQYWKDCKLPEIQDAIVYGAKQKLAFLDLLLQSTVDGKPLPDESIREEVDTFMFEGHDTTSSAISFVLFCLSNHSDVQAKVIEELQCIFSDDWNRSSTFKDLQEMKYLELVIKESLRLYPPVPLIGRYAFEDVEYDGKIIPQHTELDIDIYGLHHNPDIYPNPEEFDPDRFTIERLKDKNPFMYVPFSAGPRNCIGQKFAMLEIKAVVSKILRNVELLPTTPEHKPILLSETILKSQNGICMVLRSRTI